MMTRIIIIIIVIIICMHVKPSVVLEIRHVAVHSCGTWGMYSVPETIYGYTENNTPTYNYTITQFLFTSDSYLLLCYITISSTALHQ